MNGLALSRAYYEAYGVSMLHEQFPEWEDTVAVALTGSGSECYGYDDAVSRDHDFEPGFCLFLPSEEVMDSRAAFRLERAYAALPKEFVGFKRTPLSPVGGNRRGVLRMADFFTAHCGTPDGVLTAAQWLALPDYALLEATNGAVFRDDRGELTAIRERLFRYPEDIRRKKLAGELLTMAQAGQYNYRRCISRGETGSAQLALCEFVRAAIHAVFLLCGQYMPYYKWQFRALRELPRLSGLHESLEFLLSTDNEETTAEVKAEIVEDIAAAVIAELKEQDLTAATCGDLEKHAYSVNDHVSDGEVRNLHILAGV